MKASDYIVEYLIEQKITDVFGYPGGMVTHLMDSFAKHSSQIKAHVNYHEQAAAFCACAYSQISGLPGVAYATSGPGATNLITGIANAYFDSIPCLFITGQVNTYEAKGELKVRQKGFQEMDIVSAVQNITKYAVKINDATKLRYELEKSLYAALEGRPGPVLLDIPMDIQRAEIDLPRMPEFEKPKKQSADYQNIAKQIQNKIQEAKRPVLLAGAAVSASGCQKIFQKLVEQLKIPVVTSMIGRDSLSEKSAYQYGFIGAYGHRYANFLIEKSDCMIALGSRLDVRQTGSDKRLFAKHAQLLRIDIDENETSNQIKPQEKIYNCDLKQLLPALLKNAETDEIEEKEKWLKECRKLKETLFRQDETYSRRVIRKIGTFIPENTVITTDVGQNQVWVAQDFPVKPGQRILFSGGHGAMGYALPAAIGAYYATKRPVICCSGDGGIQMNLQELQFIAREKLPIKILLFNNRSLGMIRHFQEMYFHENYTQTVKTGGYTTPDFISLAKAYRIKSCKLKNIENEEEMCRLKRALQSSDPELIEIVCGEKTYVYPKLAINKPIYDQEPSLPRELLKKLLTMGEEE